MAKSAKVVDGELFAPTPLPVGPTPEEMKSALAIEDPTTRAAKLQGMLAQWREMGAKHGFASDAEFRAFLDGHAKTLALDLVVCLQETIRHLKDRLLDGDQIRTNELVSILAELGRQLKTIREATTPKTPPIDEATLDAEIAHLTEELEGPDDPSS